MVKELIKIKKKLPSGISYPQNKIYSDAQNNLGKLYQIGEGIPQNYLEALKWFRLSAEQGNLMVNINLGYMYDYGLVVSKIILKQSSGTNYLQSRVIQTLNFP